MQSGMIITAPFARTVGILQHPLAVLASSATVSCVHSGESGHRPDGGASKRRRKDPRIVSSIILIPALLGITACAPSVDTLVERSLADSVENAQDDLWSYREQVIADPDAAIASIDFVSDARPIYDDPTYDMGDAQYVLLATSSSPGEATLTLVAFGGAETGGGLWYEQESAVVCFDLRFSADDDSLHTEPSDCTDGQGNGVDDIPGFDEHGEPIALDRLEVRRTVTPADHPPPICQCHSGSECDCPGG